MGVTTLKFCSETLLGTAVSTVELLGERFKFR